MVRIAGASMVAGWTLSDHWLLYRNENLLQANPVFRVLAVLVAALGWSKPSRRTRRARASLSLILAEIGLLGMLLQALPAFDQVNGAAIALFLPDNLGLAIGLTLVSTRPPKRRSDDATG